MKAIGFVGSPRREGNTEILTAHTLKSIEEEGIETELVRLAGLDIRPCDACRACKDEEKCTIKDDLWPLYLKMKEADAIILSSPVYFSTATALMRTFMERAGYIGNRRKAFYGKVGGPLVVGRRAGLNVTFSEMLLWYYICGFYIAPSTYWNVAVAWEKGKVGEDKEGMGTAWRFGKNVAALTKKMKTP